MNNYKFLLISFVSVLTLSMLFSCENIEIPGGPLSAYDQVYMPAARVYPGILSDAAKPTTDTITMADTVYSVVYGANFGGYGYPEKDIHVQFAVSQALADSFNQKNGTAFTLLPEGSYTLSSTPSVISKGKLSTEPLIIGINPVKGNMTLSKSYLLPVTISNIDAGVKVNEALRTTYFIIKAVAPKKK